MELLLSLLAVATLVKYNLYVMPMYSLDGAIGFDAKILCRQVFSLSLVLNVHFPKTSIPPLIDADKSLNYAKLKRKREE